MSQSTLLLVLVLLGYNIVHGYALPQNAGENNTTAVNDVSSARDGNTSCGSSGQVTNVIIQGGRGGVAGPQGDRGERGPPGPPGPPGPAAPSNGGVSYTRWGSTTCPTTQGTELLYQGAVVGSHHQEAGSSSYLCLHNEPQFLETTPGQQTFRTRLYGTEYESFNSPPAFPNIFRHDAPCSVCYTPRRTTTIIIPGRITCPSTWTREYHGYFMGTSHQAVYRSRAPICIDLNAESVAGSAGHNVRSLLYFVETTCIGIRCPPYSDGAELTCVVCTK